MKLQIQSNSTEDGQQKFDANRQKYLDSNSLAGVRDDGLMSAGKKLQKLLLGSDVVLFPSNNGLVAKKGLRRNKTKN